MGKITKGILGPISGTVGTVIGGTWKGISYLRSQSSAERTHFSMAQLEQQGRFKAAVKFLSSMTPLLAISFRDYAIKMTGFNNATRYTLINAITGIYPNYDIAYSVALVCRGDLLNAASPSAAANGNGEIKFTWQDNSGTGRALPTDTSILAVYCPELNQCIYTTTGAARSAGTAKLNAGAFTGKVVHTYLSFMSADLKGIATSIYTGQLTVS